MFGIRRSSAASQRSQFSVDSIMNTSGFGFDQGQLLVELPPQDRTGRSGVDRFIPAQMNARSGGYNSNQAAPRLSACATVSALFVTPSGAPACRPKILPGK